MRITFCPLTTISYALLTRGHHRHGDVGSRVAELDDVASLLRRVACLRLRGDRERSELLARSSEQRDRNGDDRSGSVIQLHV